MSRVAQDRHFNGREEDSLLSVTQGRLYYNGKESAIAEWPIYLPDVTVANHPTKNRLIHPKHW